MESHHTVQRLRSPCKADRLLPLTRNSKNSNADNRMGKEVHLQKRRRQNTINTRRHPAAQNPAGSIQSTWKLNQYQHRTRNSTQSDYLISDRAVTSLFPSINTSSRKRIDLIIFLKILSRTSRLSISSNLKYSFTQSIFL